MLGHLVKRGSGMGSIIEASFRKYHVPQKKENENMAEKNKALVTC